jgi:hypothetical protein
MTFENSRDDMLVADYEEVLERPGLPGAGVPTHTHPYEANALSQTSRTLLNKAIRD